MKLQYIDAGQIVTTHGIRGEMKVLCWLDSTEDLCDFERCRIDGREYKIASCRVQKTCNLLKVDGIDTMEAAQSMRGKVVQLYREDISDEVIFAAELVGIENHMDYAPHELSGGQKQRVAISRAVLKKSEILIFDDTTSALDLKTEANLYNELKQMHSGMTKIIIAQRIASIKNADRIVVLDNGKLSAVGTHEELLKSNKIYQEVYESQTKMTEEIPE